MQAVQHCPANDITSTCKLQSQGSVSLRVPVSITDIQGMWGAGVWEAHPLSCLAWEQGPPGWGHLSRQQGEAPVSLTSLSLDGDIMCSEDSWNITKAVFRVQASCPGPTGKRDMVKGAPANVTIQQVPGPVSQSAASSVLQL